MQHSSAHMLQALVDFEEVLGMEPPNFVGDDFSRVTQIYRVTQFNIACCYSSMGQVCFTVFPRSLLLWSDPLVLSLGVLCDSLSRPTALQGSVFCSMTALSVLVCIHVLLCYVYQGWGFS